MYVVTVPLCNKNKLKLIKKQQQKKRMALKDGVMMHNRCAEQHINTLKRNAFPCENVYLSNSRHQAGFACV